MLLVEIWVKNKTNLNSFGPLSLTIRYFCQFVKVKTFFYKICLELCCQEDQSKSYISINLEICLANLHVQLIENYYGENPYKLYLGWYSYH